VAAKGIRLHAKIGGFKVQKESFNVANVKCGGCATTIKQGLLDVVGVDDVEVDIAEGRVEVSGKVLTRMALQNKLTELGYPVR